LRQHFILFLFKNLSVYDNIHRYLIRDIKQSPSVNIFDMLIQGIQISCIYFSRERYICGQLFIICMLFSSVILYSLKTMVEFLFIRAIILLVVSILCATSQYTCDKNIVPCGCGRAAVGINARIVNGENSIPDSWPMMVSLRDNSEPSEHICGGTILSELYVLTAAHCVTDRFTGIAVENISIAAGVHSISQADQIIRKVDKIIVHPLWKELHRETQYDIAILQLAEPLDLGLNSSISRTCLPPRQNTREDIMQYPSNGTKLVVIGWGRLGRFGEIPDILQQVTVRSIHHFDKICANTIGDPSIHFCAGLYEGGKGEK
jgi:hypothetical protein